MPWLMASPSLICLVPPQALLTQLWAKWKTNSAKRDALGRLCIFPTRADRSGFHRCWQPEEHKGAESCQQLKAAGPRRATSCQWWEGPDLLMSNQHREHIQVKALWHCSPQVPCSITIPVNPNGVWYLSLLEMCCLCPQPAAHSSRWTCTARPSRWQWMCWLYCPQDTVCYTKQEIKFQTK